MSDEPIILGDRYRLDEVIGRGGMAEVWRAQDLRLGRQVAVKRLRVDLASDSTFQARFNREAQSAAGLNHPNIVSVYDTGEQFDPSAGVVVPYIVMELVEGRTLRDYLRSGTQITPRTAFRYTAGVLDALSFSHKNGIIHRDIKPANVMLTDNGQIKVMDFGIARAVSDTSATMTQTAAIIGTAQYLSPEQARGETVDSRSDLYSTGCLLYELLTGRPPFIGDSPVSVAYQHVRETPVPPSQLGADITPDMDAVTIKALAKAPDERYQSAKQMREDITRLLSGEQVTAELPAISGATAVLASTTQPTTQVTQVSEETASRPARALDPEVYDDDYDEPAGYEPNEPNRRRPSVATVLLVILTVILLATLAYFAWRLMTPDDNANLVEVPTVKGFQEEAAKSQLTNAKLVPKVTTTQGPADTKGTVVEQDPAGGLQVQVGSTVTITINTGPPVAKVPDGLVGKPESEARNILRTAGFTNVVSLDAPAGKEPPTAITDSVVDLSPAAGTVLAPDAQVTLYLATGESPMPNVTNMSEKDARDLLTRQGFTNVSMRYQKTSDKTQDGIVFSQAPVTGEVVRRANTVTLDAYQYEPPPSTPPPPSPPATTAPAPPSSDKKSSPSSRPSSPNSSQRSTSGGG